MRIDFKTSIRAWSIWKKNSNIFSNSLIVIPSTIVNLNTDSPVLLPEWQGSRSTWWPRGPFVPSYNSLDWVLYCSIMLFYLDLVALFLFNWADWTKYTITCLMLTVLTIKKNENIRTKLKKILRDNTEGLQNLNFVHPRDRVTGQSAFSGLRLKGKYEDMQTKPTI